MGTRAAFWIGDPRNLESREWLGTVAWDGYPSGFDGALEKITTEQDFRDFVAEQAKRDDFGSPERGWPFPWADDVFLTDYTYAFFDGGLRMTCFHGGFGTLEEYEADEDGERFGGGDKLPSNVPAPQAYDTSQPDSILLLSAKPPTG